MVVANSWPSSSVPGGLLAAVVMISVNTMLAGLTILLHSLPLTYCLDLDSSAATREIRATLRSSPYPWTGFQILHQSCARPAEEMCERHVKITLSESVWLGTT